MRIHRLEVIRFRIPFLRPLATAAGVHHARDGVLVRLWNADGVAAAGEASLRPEAPAAELQQVWEELGELAGTPATLERSSLPVASPTARAAVETALSDLQARTAGIPLATVLSAAPRRRVAVNATLDNCSAGEAVTRARDLMAAGFRCIKLKVSADADAIEDKLRALRAAVGDGLRIRLDPNAAWHPADAVSMLRRLARYGLDYVEQPLASIEQMAELRAATGVALAADESATTADAVREIAARRAADVIVVKPALLGPLSALELIRTAHAHDLAVTVTSVLDTSIGIAAALHVAAAAPAHLLECGLATAHLLSGDLVHEPLHVEHGAIEVPRSPGLGIEVDDTALARWRVTP